MKPGPAIPCSSDAFHKWSDEHRAQLWDMIERLGKGEVTHKEARKVLREEKKALSAISKQGFGPKPSRGPHGYPPSHVPKKSKAKNATAQDRQISSQAPPIG
jgi:hypothetical protein